MLSFSGQQGNKRTKNMHRRNKQEISRQFICPYPKCGKSYGAESSLKTHMKQKHPSHIVQTTPKKPISRVGRPKRKASKDNFDGFDENDCWNDYGYVTFLQTTMSIEPCDWTRSGEDDFATLDVWQLIDEIKQRNENWIIPEKLIRYFQDGKKIFKEAEIKRLYTQIIQALNAPKSKRERNNKKQRKQQVEWIQIIRKLVM